MTSKYMSIFREKKVTLFRLFFMVCDVRFYLMCEKHSGQATTDLPNKIQLKNPCTQYYLITTALKLKVPVTRVLPLNYPYNSEAAVSLQIS